MEGAWLDTDAISTLLSFNYLSLDLLYLICLITANFKIKWYFL